MLHSQSSNETPYNSKNVLVTECEINDILRKYDISVNLKDICLYQKAFVNKSYCTRKNENFLNGNMLCPSDCLPLQEESNERLEFLGDAILNITVANYLFERYPDENEGFLTRMRTKLVNGKMLAFLNKQIPLKKYVLLSKQIEENDGRNNLNILEDTFEAFLAAIHLDLGFESVQTWILSVLEKHLDFSDLILQNNNFKDMLLKYYQQNYSYAPRFYEVNIDSNNSNNQKVYIVCIKDNTNNVLSVGKGSSKKEAENDAAKNMILQKPEMRIMG